MSESTVTPKWKRAARVGAILLLVVVVSLVGAFLTVREPDRPVEALRERWAKAPSEFLELDGMQVHFRDEGPKDDPLPLVLLHGTSASLHTWDGWVEALGPDRRILRFDLPAFGLTGPHPQSKYDIESYTSFVVGMLDARGIDRCVLGGNSLGGYIAWATALEHPTRVEKLILVDASGLPFEAESMPIGFRLAQMPIARGLMEKVLPRSVVRQSVENVYADPGRVTPELVDRYFELTLRAGNRHALAERFRQTQPGPLSDRVGELRVPTLILWGLEDRLIPPALGTQFEAAIPGSRLVQFEGLGHVPHEEGPVETAAVVREFLESDGGTAAAG